MLWADSFITHIFLYLSPNERWMTYFEQEDYSIRLKINRRVVFVLRLEQKL